MSGLQKTHGSHTYQDEDQRKVEILMHLIVPLLTRKQLLLKKTLFPLGILKLDDKRDEGC